MENEHLGFSNNAAILDQWIEAGVLDDPLYRRFLAPLLRRWVASYNAAVAAGKAHDAGGPPVEGVP